MVLIVGTSHPIQLGTDDAYRGAAEELIIFLESLNRTYNFRAVAEEMNAEALAENHCATSVPMRVAESLGVQHLFCDPERSVRANLGILQENDIRAKGFLSGWSASEISSHIVASHCLRERYWLNQLHVLNQWPVVFICGADHVASFCALLKQEGIIARIGAQDWGADMSNKGNGLH